MRLNRWQRIGVIVSFVWAIGAAIVQRTADIERAQSFMAFAYKVCTESKALANDFDFKPCGDEMAKNWAIWIDGSWGNVAAVSLLPIPLGWLGVLIVIRLFRWVRVGAAE